MLQAALIFSGWHFLWLALSLLLVAAGVLIWSYLPAPNALVRWLCPLLKLAGLTALAICLLEPLWSGQRAKPGANLFVVIADNSQGLQIH
ncbi:MAG TPA: hypothetical protein VGR76_22755, partial [Candidatus Angelobacter sp.]|nr:hypothetical protein [Candidatus Angelobacter sp.]